MKRGCLGSRLNFSPLIFEREDVTTEGCRVEERITGTIIPSVRQVFVGNIMLASCHWACKGVELLLRRGCSDPEDAYYKVRRPIITHPPKGSLVMTAKPPVGIIHKYRIISVHFSSRTFDGD